MQHTLGRMDFPIGDHGPPFFSAAAEHRCPCFWSTLTFVEPAPHSDIADAVSVCPPIPNKRRRFSAEGAWPIVIFFPFFGATNWPHSPFGKVTSLPPFLPGLKRLSISFFAEEGAFFSPEFRREKYSDQLFFFPPPFQERLHLFRRLPWLPPSLSFPNISCCC